jgi:kinetochore protein NNF1
LNAKLEESAKAEFEDILNERDAVRQLNELDRLVGEARARREQARNGTERDAMEGVEAEGEERVPYVDPTFYPCATGFPICQN